MSEKKKEVNASLHLNYLINLQHYDDALSYIGRLKKQNKMTPHLSFLEATIWGAKGNIHIYSLYPLLDMHLFYLPTIDWGKFGKRRNPYLSYLDRYFEDEKEGDEEGNSTSSDSERLRRYQIDGVTYGEEDLALNSKNKEKAILLKMMNYLWGFYELIPNLSLVPSFFATENDYIKNALLLLDSIRNKGDDSLMRHRVLYQCFLSGLMFLDTLRKAFPMKNAGSPFDFFCQFEIKKMIHFYPDLLYYGMTFLDGFKEVYRNYPEKISKAGKFEKVLKDLPSNLSVKFVNKEFRGYQHYFCHRFL